ncbi:hypothetical protein ASC99_30680 [Kitasatospora sp. Root107]|nr:hypothetical protein ASC99_30680 [Kitasatospora sp. Root107]
MAASASGLAASSGTQVDGGGLQCGQHHRCGQRAEVVDGGGVGEQGDASAPAGVGVDAVRVQQEVGDDAVVGVMVQECEVAGLGGRHAQSLGDLAGRGGGQGGVG